MSALLFRNARQSDLDPLYELAMNSGIGITTLPKNRDILSARLNCSIDSIQHPINKPQQEYYLFVLEDMATHEVVGTSAIQASLGHDAPFYSYRRSKRTRVSWAIGLRCEESALHLVNDHDGQSELCTLYLKPAYRHSHQGVFLARARFLFMAQHANRFEERVIAEMRGVADENGSSPFWNSVGHHFFKMPFSQADALTIATNKQFIADLLPEHPILTNLLPLDAQAAIGKTHALTTPALTILLKEGFNSSGYVDIFDAGPILEATTQAIKTIQNSQVMPIIEIVSNLSGEDFLIANTLLDFRATMGRLTNTKKGVLISTETAECLQLNRGDCVRFSPLKGST